MKTSKINKLLKKKNYIKKKNPTSIEKKLSSIEKKLSFIKKKLFSIKKKLFFKKIFILKKIKLSLKKKLLFFKRLKLKLKYKLLYEERKKTQLKMNKNISNEKKLFKKRLGVFFSFKYNNFFIKKIFQILIKKGLKMKIYKLYFNWINIIKFKLIKKNINKHVYLSCLLNKILPKVNYSNLYKKGKTHTLPNIKKSSFKQNLKLSSLIASWIKKSFVKRKEKTFVLKFFSELNDIKLNKGSSIKLKKDFYRSFFLNKKYYRYKKWI